MPRDNGGHPLIEEYVTGVDLRIVVIGYEVVAAAVRRPAQVQGDGRHTVAELIEKQSRRRAAATGRREPHPGRRRDPALRQGRRVPT